ncbi:MAG: SpoIIIAH-like family protein [Thermaerobacter sp.]|nr:SpoIIIAH-like family protein [Thermaerobacter sp.]
MNRSALVRFIAFLGVLAVLVGYVAYHHPSTPGSGGSQAAGARPSTAGASSRVTANYFANLKQSRDQLMSHEIATLQGIIKNSSVSASARSQAELTLVQDQQSWKQAIQVEGVLSGHGFPLAVVTLDPNSAQIVVGQARLTTQQVAQIADTTTQITGIPPQDIVIIPKTGPGGSS